MDILTELENQLLAAQERLEKSTSEANDIAYAEVLRLERAVAAEKREPHALPSDFPIQWDVGAPLPHVMMDDHSTFLTFFLVC